MRRPLTLTVDAWGNVIVARTLGNEGTFVAKLDKEGRVIWQQILATSRDSLPAGLAGALDDSAVQAEQEPRDSVEPVLIDSQLERMQLEQMQKDLRGPSKLFRGLGVAAVLAALFAFGLAGGAALRHGQLPGASAAGQPVAAAVGIRGAMQTKAQAAMDDVTLTVDDSTEFADVEDVEDTQDAPASDAVPEPEEVAAETNAVASSAPAGAPLAKPGQHSLGEDPPMLELPDEMVHGPVPEPSDEPFEPALSSAAAIRQETLARLEAGDDARAAELGMQLVAAAPSDAFSYLCLGAALQAQGRIAEAATAYRTCVQFAQHGDVSECQALAGL